MTRGARILLDVRTRYDFKDLEQYFLKLYFIEEMQYLLLPHLSKIAQLSFEQDLNLAPGMYEEPISTRVQQYVALFLYAV